MFLWIAAFVVNAAAVNPNSIKTLLANGLSTFLIKASPVFNNGPKGQVKNYRDCRILCNWALDNFIFAEELFEKALRSFETFVIINNNLCGKLLSS